jgi:hypothetical protein
MKWAFIVARNSIIEKVRIFTDFWEGCSYTDDFIRHIDDNFANGSVSFPAYNRNEFYKNNDLTVGLYKDC